MKIAIDAMGGDNAPQEIVAGACDALRADASIEKMLLVGDQEKIEALIDEMWNGRGRAELLAAGGGQRPTPMQLILHLARYAAAHSDLPKNSTAGFT